MSNLANAYGNFLSNAIPYYQAMPALITPNATLIKPGGRVAAFVRSTGAQDGEDHFASSGMLVRDLNSALARCRSGAGDIVYVLPGHTENIATADAMSNLVAGTQIIGTGRPGATNNPSLTWSAVAGTFLLDVADCSIQGMTLNMGGADAVTAPITVTGAGCSMIGNFLNLGTSSVLETITPITVSTGAHDFLFSANKVQSLGGAVCTNAISITAAVNRPNIVGNDFDVECAGATNGVIDISAAAVQVRIVGNLIVNRRASAAVSVRWSDTAALTGVIAKNYLGFTADVTVATAALSAAGTSNHAMRAFENLGHDENQGNAIASVMTSAATIE
jgi:hypothetical protein